jgi:CRP/FNR family transcriptional regulator
MLTKDAILGLFGFYEAALESERREIGDAAVVVHLPEGTPFYREGDVTRDFGLVGRGDIRVFKTATNGRELTLYHVRDREPCLVNMLSVVLGRGAMASAVAEVPTDAVLVPAADMRRLLATSDTVRRFVFEAMSKRLVDVMQLVEEIVVQRMDARLASWLLRRFAARPAGDPLAATHDNLAAELGTAREVVSRVLKEFERKGAVRLSRGHIHLVDEHVLSRISLDLEDPRGEP